MTINLLPLVIDVWVLGIAYWTGRAYGEHVGRWEWLLVLIWPLVASYGLLWGYHRRRWWFCWTWGVVRHGRPELGHNWRTTLGNPGRGRQCRRCWRVER